MRYDFQAGGPIHASSRVYIERQADRDALSTVLRGDYLSVVAPRREGKTSLLYHLATHLREKGWRCSLIDLSTLADLPKPDWYAALGQLLSRDLTPGQIPTLNNPHDMREYLLDQVLLWTKGQPYVAIMLDEVEALLTDSGKSFSDEFFMFLRELHHYRYEQEGIFTVVTAGNVDPSNFIQNPFVSSFNIGRKITIQDFDRDQVRLLANSLSMPENQLESVIDRVYYWTDGQPYLTQLLYLYLSQSSSVCTPDIVDKAILRVSQEYNSFIIDIYKQTPPTLLDYLRDNKTISNLNKDQLLEASLTGLIKQDKYDSWRISNHFYEFFLEIGSIRQEWESLITPSLKRRGEVLRGDVPVIPQFAWKALANEYKAKGIPLVATENALRLERGFKALATWGKAFSCVSEALARTGSLESIESLSEMAGTLSQAVGLHTDNQWKSLGMLWAVKVNHHVLMAMKIPQNFPLIFVPTPAISSDIPGTLAGLCSLMKLPPFFSIVILVSPDEENLDVSLIRDILYNSPYDFVVLSPDDLFCIFIDPAPSIRLVRYIAKQISPGIVSPFIVRDPIPSDGHMFFGRDEEIRNIILRLSVRSFAVIGNRRIGKSSLLRQVQQILERDPSYFVKPVITLQAVQNLQGLYRYLQEEPQFRFEAGETTPEMFRIFVRGLSTQAGGRTIVLLIDEPDALLLHDEKQEYQLSSVWRELSETGHCRFVFAGHRVLSRIMRDARSPFFNFAEPLPLGFLDQSHAKDLLRSPLKDIGFELKDASTILERVWELSAGHPNIIQLIGNELMKKLHRGDSVIRIDHLEDVISDERFFLPEYQYTIWGGDVASEMQGVSPLERAILLLGNPEGFTKPNIEQALSQAGFYTSSQVVRNALNTLITFNLLEIHKGTYTCTIKHFLAMLNNEKDDLLDLYKEQVNE